jgi:hypothetical protein
MARTKKSHSSSRDETAERPTTDVALANPTRPIAASEMRPSLSHLRDRALHKQTETAHTIAELEAWRAEIDATIAFLKAQG